MSTSVAGVKTAQQAPLSFCRAAQVPGAHVQSLPLVFVAMILDVARSGGGSRTPDSLRSDVAKTGVRADVSVLMDETVRTPTDRQTHRRGKRERVWRERGRASVQPRRLSQTSAAHGCFFVRRSRLPRRRTRAKGGGAVMARGDDVLVLVLVVGTRFRTPALERRGCLWGRLTWCKPLRWCARYRSPRSSTAWTVASNGFEADCGDGEGKVIKTGDVVGRWLRSGFAKWCMRRCARRYGLAGIMTKGVVGKA
ncbi:hypothetical protein DFH06DRAFT_1253590 [Mycena polygramma]|nr:hypothetical protein DFH06DRAFT_1253590 [Mycena polygramma]